MTSLLRRYPYTTGAVAAVLVLASLVIWRTHHKREECQARGGIYLTRDRACVPGFTPETRTTSSRADRSRPLTALRPAGRVSSQPASAGILGAQRATRVLNWWALARCESGNNPRAVSPSGRYRGAFQMDTDFWRTYGGLRFASRPDLATYGEQLNVARAGYAARGREPWPYCGSRL